MKKIELTLTAEEILDHKFPGVSRGYDPYLVDEFLDKIIQDYKFVETNNLIAKTDYDALEKEYEELKANYRKLEVEHGIYKVRFSNIKVDDNVTSDNMELIKKVNRYEKLLYKYNIDPNEE